MRDLGLHRIFPERLTQKEAEKFLTFPDEKLIVAVRHHPIPLVIALAQILIVSIALSTIASGATIFFFKSITFSLLVYFTIFIIGSGIIIKELIDWYFHIYLVTNKRVTEVKYSPLFSEKINSVLLDQLRCTEIDADLQGFVAEILDLGDVAITFDRPTHQEEFVLKGIRSPRKVANLLSTELHGEKTNNIESQHVWLRRNPVNYGGALQN